MAKTIPSEWNNVGLDEIRTRELISFGRRREMLGHIQANNRSTAADVPVNLVALNCQARGIQDVLIVGVYRLIGRGRVCLISRNAQLQGWMYGSQVEVRFDVAAGFSETATNAGALAWTSSPANTVGSPPVGGFFDVEIWARLTDPAGTLEHCGITENNSSLLFDGTDFETTLVNLHNESVLPDTPYDSALVQRVLFNARRVQWDRTRRHLHLYPAYDGTPNRRHALSSAFWRLDGPYVCPAQPWCDRALVDITVQVSGAFNNLSVELAVISELEDFDQVKATAGRVVSKAPGVHSLSWEVPIRSGADSETLIWIAFRSETDTAASELTTFDVQSQGDTPDLVYCDDNAVLLGFTQSEFAQHGLCGFIESDTIPVSADPTVKNALPYEPPSAFFDICTVVGVDPTKPLTTPGRARIRVSPHKGTGYLDGAQFNAIEEVGGQVLFAGNVSLRHCGVAYLNGIYIEGRQSDVPAYDKGAAQPKTAPRASAWRNINVLTNAQAGYGTSVLCTRHVGNFQISPPLTLSPGNQVIYSAGKYLHMAGGSRTGTAIIGYQVPILQDPNLGASSGLLVERVYARCSLMVMTNAGAQVDEDAEIKFQISSGPVESMFFPVIPGRPTDGQQPTEGDAAISATADVTWVDQVTRQPIAPQTSVANASSQEFTWPRQGATLEVPWRTSPTFSDILPLAPYPKFINIDIRTGNTGTKRDVSVVIAGLHVWCGPRI